ncbi:MAG: response regulator [Alphaproteobacteria bacterium]|nr:response regulator [Alphaproteobacteria bacterium]
MSFPAPISSTGEPAIDRANARWIRRLVAFAFLLVILLWTLVFQQVVDERSTQRRSVTDNLSNIAVTLSHNISRTSGELDTLLQFMRAMRRSKDQSVTWQEIVTEDYTLNRHTVQIAVIDKNGMMVTSTKMLNPGKPVDLSDREHYRIHRDGAGDHLFISKPVLGRASGKWSVQFTRPLLDEEGGFDGVIVISLDPAKLTRIYGNLDLGKQGGVVIVGTDDIIRAGTGDYASMLGKTFSSGPVQHDPGSHGAAVRTEIEHHNGTTLIAAKTPIDGYPLRVIVLGGSSWLMRVYALVLGAILFTALAVYACYEAIRYRLRENSLLHEQNRFLVEKQVAEAASRAKGEFLAVMSHEIRTPLNGVLGALELIKTEPLSPTGKRHLDIAATSGEYLLSLIDDILVFSKLEEGQLKFEENSQSLQQIFESLESLFRPLTEKAGNALILDVSEGLPAAILVDAVRLRQVLINLLSNANKFTSKGSITLTGELRARDEQTVTMRFAVNDTGIGIPAEKQGVIFEKFKSLDSTFSRRTDGTGLGLAICDEIVRAMGGQIEVESEYGKGSSFFFELTFKITEEVAKISAAEANHETAAPRRLRILLAEDNPTNAYITTQYLITDGHEIVHAENGNEAVNHARQKLFDLILMDISMPEKDGLTAAREIRDMDGPNQSTPIIALSAHAASGTEDHVTKAGMNAYLTKPIRRTRLIEATRRLAVPRAFPQQLDMAPCEPVIEFSELSEFFQDRNIDAGSPLMTIFVTELETKRATMAHLLETRDQHAAKQLAHAIFGSASTVGAARLASICKHIENQAESAETFDWALLDAAVKALDETLAEFRVIIAANKAPPATSYALTA